MRLIDADAFLETIRPIRAEDAYTACTFETAKQLIAKHINNATTIDAVPVVHGRWVEHPMEIMCSVCGTQYKDYIVCTPINMNGGRYVGLEHCPHCGAKMDLDDKRETK